MQVAIRSRDAWFPGLALAVAFFGIGLVTLSDFGLTWDEPETISAALQNSRSIRAFLHGESFQHSAHELAGFYFVMDTLRGEWARLTVERLGMMSYATAFHSFHLALSALSVYLLYRIAFVVGRRVRPAFLTALTLCLLPKFLAHSQNNPKDLPALFMFLLTALVIVRLPDSRRWRFAVAAGVLLGLAVSTRTLCVVIPVVIGLWLLTDKRNLATPTIRQLALLTLISVPALFLFWPWLWADPLARVLEAAQYVLTFRNPSPIHVLYFGNVYTAETTPWHYFAGSFLISTPVWYLVASALSLWDPSARSRVPIGSLARLGLVWCGVLFVLEMIATSRYDGVRHLLVLLPGFCILVGCGIDNALRLARAARVRRPAITLLLAACVVGGYLSVAVEMVRVHPYQDAWLNILTNTLLAGASEDVFEVEYWGSTLKEGSEWLNDHAGPEARVFVPWISDGLQHQDYYLKHASQPPWPQIFKHNDGNQYIMLITRKAFYNDFHRFLEANYSPVFTIRRQKATLLKIYRNIAPELQREPRSGKLSMQDTAGPS